MSEYTASRIEKPPYFKLAPLYRGRSSREPYVIGFDSEACSNREHKHATGTPFLYQFAHPDGATDLVRVPHALKWDSLVTFLEYLYVNCRDQSREYLVFGFNLQYEYTQLFRDVSHALVLAPEFHLGERDARRHIDNPSTLTVQGRKITFYLTAMNDRRYTFHVTFGNSKRRIRVIDAYAFFHMSLDAAAKAVGAGAKEPKPPVFDCAAAEDESFRAYAKQDAILTQKLGAYITALHEEYDVSTCISAPQFAAKVYRHRYMSGEIEHPEPMLEQDGLDSYHGGKNGYYLDKPDLLPGVWHVDIRSAYPEAMKHLPDIEQAEWTFRSHYAPGAHALWRVKGIYKPCKYHCLMHRSGWAKAGMVSLTTTGYELDTAVRHGEIELLACEGWTMQGPGGGGLARYVDDFYALKRYAKTPAEKAAAKLFLNSLYGKFFQKVALGMVGSGDVESGEILWTNEGEQYDYVAGGLYHPPIASLITGFVRAKIHDMEHDMDAIMTSTDGIFCFRPPDPSLLGDELGQLDAARGTLTIWRERTYVFDHDDGTPPLAALHGWRGSVAQLRRVPLVAGLTYRYTADQMITLKQQDRAWNGESYSPGTFATLEYVLDLRGKQGS